LFLFFLCVFDLNAPSNPFSHSLWNAAAGDVGIYESLSNAAADDVSIYHRWNFEVFFFFNVFSI